MSVKALDISRIQLVV